MKKFVLLTFLLPLFSVAQIDCHTNSTSSTPIYTGSYIGFGQTFTCSKNSTIEYVEFRLQKSGSPTGNAYAQIFEMSGTYGTSGIPSGSALATSDPFDISTLSTSFENIRFTFSNENKILLEPDYYVVVFKSDNGNASNYVEIRRAWNTHTHDGNGLRTSDFISFTAVSAADTYFCLFGSQKNIFMGINF